MKKNIQIIYILLAGITAFSGCKSKQEMDDGAVIAIEWSGAETKPVRELILAENADAVKGIQEFNGLRKRAQFEKISKQELRRLIGFLYSDKMPTSTTLRPNGDVQEYYICMVNHEVLTYWEIGASEETKAIFRGMSANLNKEARSCLEQVIVGVPIMHANSK